MEDDMFLRCLEANLLSDMALQGIEQISKVTAPCHLTLSKMTWVKQPPGADPMATKFHCILYVTRGLSHIVQC